MRGLIDRLDYLEGLGVNAIWMAPLFKNRPVQGTGADASAGYHGYWITDFTQLDPHFGTNAELRDARRRRACARDQGLLRRDHEPHRGRDRLRRGHLRLRLEGRGALLGRRRARVRRRRLRRLGRLPGTEPPELPLHARLPDGGGRDRQGARLAERPHHVPQPRQLDLRRRERALRRLLRPRRPLHRAARGRPGDDRHLLGLGLRRRHRRLPDRHGQARQRRVLAGVGAGARAARRKRGDRRLLHVRRGLRLESRLHVALHEGREAPGRARLPLPEPSPLLRVRVVDHRPRGPLRRRRLLHRRRLERLQPADLPRQPRHGPDRQLPPHRQRGRDRRRAARARRACALADVSRAWPPRRLLRRRAGLHRRRRRQGRTAGHVPEPGGLVQRRRPDRDGRDHGRLELRPDASALPGARRPGRATGRPPCPARGRADPSLRDRRPRRLRLLADPARRADRVRRRAQQHRDAAVGAGADVLERDGLHLDLRRRRGGDDGCLRPSAADGAGALRRRLPRGLGARRRARATRS